LNGLLGGKSEAVEIYSDSSLVPEEWKHLFSFAMVRNPYDRFLSAYRMFETKNFSREPIYGSKRLTPEIAFRVVEDDSISLIGNSLHSRLRRHLIPMTHPFLGLSEAQYVGRFENLEYEWKKLCELLKVGYPSLRAERKSSRVGYRDFYTPDLRTEMERLFRADLDTFSYTY
jgi:hypothetical protein